MTTIVKRTTKGSPLTHAEVDANFDNLNQFKVEQNSAGNVGLGGVTPSAWLSGGGFIQVPGNGFLGNNAGYSSNAMLFGSNAYYDTAWKYKSSGLAATFFQAGNGSFYWHIAASGTAGSAISFTQAMTLDASGNLGIGTTSPTSILDVNKNVAGSTRVTVQNGNAAGFPGFRALGPAVDLRMEVDSGSALASIGTTSNHAVRFRTNDVERMRIDASGNVGIGTATPVYRATIQGSATAGVGIAMNLNNPHGYGTGIGTAAVGIRFNRSPSDSGSTGVMADIFAGNQNETTSTAGYLAFATRTGASEATTERMRIDASGNVLVTGSGGLGYGTGSGGTVTQATSKSTAVTLNKPSGQITMNNAALAAGATVYFTLANSSIGLADVVAVNPVGFGSYTVRCNQILSAGNAQIAVTNNSAGSLSEAVVINFAIIKGATA